MQSPDRHQEHEDEGLQAPPRLVSALKRLPPARIFVPPAMDETVLRAAQRHLAQSPSPRFQWFRRMPWLAATAAVVILLVAVPLVLRRHAGASASTNQNIHLEGNVDILDAFALARQIKNGPVNNRSLDINHDGVVDDRDVAALAAQAVKLDKKGHS